MQPSGELHLGNYLGSMKPNLEFTKDADESFYFVADLHALTTLQDAAKLKQSREDIVLDYLAAGFDPKKAHIYYQSEIPAHTELMWLLSTVAPMGLLERAVSYKDKVEKGVSASVGLFTYPVLMAADILLYQADKVPVGKDQKQHVEMTRDIAQKFNNTFGEVFTLPEPVIREDVAVVPGVDGQKMSKSYGNVIPIFGSESAIKKAIMGIVTDSKGMNDPKDPETCVIYNIHKLILSTSDAEVLAAEYKNGLPYGEGKKKLLADFMEYFGVMRAKRATLKSSDVRKAVDAGKAVAAKLADKTLTEAKKAVGLL